MNTQTADVSGGTGLKGRRVLVAEDEGIIAMDLEMTLEDADAYVVGPFATVDALLGAIDKGRIDCAILDVNLADGEVFPAAKRLHDAGIPFVFHSGHAESDLLRERFPAASICSKPCAADELLRRLTRLTH